MLFTILVTILGSLHFLHLCPDHLGDLTAPDKESLSLLNKHNMVEFYVNKISLAAFKMTKPRLT